MNSSCLPGSAIICVLFAMSAFSFRFFFRLHLFKVLIEPFEARVPELPVLGNPIRNILQRGRLKFARTPLRVLSATDKFCLLEDLEMFRDRRQSHAKGLCQFLDTGLTLRQTSEY